MSLRIAYVCSDPGIPPDGTKGASVHFREFAQAIRDAGHELHSFLARKGRVASPQLHIVAPEKASGSSREALMLAANAAMIAALKEEGPFDLVLERLSLFGMAASSYARDAGIPHAVEVNAPLWEEATRYRSLAFADTAKSLALEVLARSTLVHTVSSGLAELLTAEGIAEEKLYVSGNGVNKPRFDAAKPAPRPEGSGRRPLLLFIGSLKPWHGIDFLLEAFQQSSLREDCALWIVGEGPLAERVQAAADALPEAVLYNGACTHEEIPGLLLAADLALAPYPADAPGYFSPLKLVEAMAARTSVVASRVPCVLDTMGNVPFHGFQADDADDLERAVRNALADERSGPRQSCIVPDDLSWTSKARALLARLEGAAS